MSNSGSDRIISVFNILLAVVFALSTGCTSTKHIPDNQSLLKKNRITLKADKPMANKGEMKDNLSKYVIQKPNSRSLGIPMKLWLYNHRYNKLHDRPDSLLPKSTERPAILDTMVMQRSMQNMKSYLFYQGYFYAKIKDTFKVKHKRSVAIYNVDAGKNYEINNVHYHVQDSAIARIVRAGADETVLQKGIPFSYSLLEDERSRITLLVRNSGYYRFTLENVNFIEGLDTVDKTIFKNAESPFENAVDFISKEKTNKNNTIDITLNIQLAEDSLAYTKYTINSVTVYPDYKSVTDLSDTTMIKKTIDETDFKYHNAYVHPKVLYEHIYLNKGDLFSEKDFNKTYTKLNELGIFQYLRVQPRENRNNKGTLDYDILLNKSKKFDFVPNTEASSGSTYAFGISGGVNFRDKNFLKGANLLTIGVNGGVELSYNENEGRDFFNHFAILTKYYGINASLDFPKFLAPVAASQFDNSNIPHTIIGGGENVMDRVNYFTLLNTSANFSYSWHETETKTWSLSPAFINIIKVPIQSAAFDTLLAQNEYLKNSYKENFIEGENISFTYDNMIVKHGINYSFLKIGLEEAGGILGAINQLGVALNDLYKIEYAQYTKFDFDYRHYFAIRHSVLAFRFDGGIGIPYGQSSTLPYIKQYFAGGPYSLRGWRIRTLGPGSYYDANNINNVTEIDRTGDIKLEVNGEYRFPITPLFAGAVKMKGALFADAGNIWLAQKDPGYPGGEFSFNTLGQDIAADIGAGTRFEIASFLTLRVDVAIPVKKPYIGSNNGWVFNQIDIYDPTWRANNIIFNISIGYPF